MKKLKRLLYTTILAISSSYTYAQQGVWSGELNIQGMKLPIVFRFDENQCTMDSPAQSVKGIKAQATTTPNGEMKINIPTIMATFNGTLIDDTIKGTFTQRSLKFPLILTQGEKKLMRPQTPEPPFPYTTEEISFSNGGYTFNGTLTIPTKYSKKTPAVVFVTGSGQQNRDSEVFGHKTFAVIADALARNGIASLRYDDYGVGDTTCIFMNHTTYDAMADAETAIELLKKRFPKIEIIGHSEGGTIALMIASKGKIDFAISLAGMVISGRETLLDQNCNLLIESGAPADFLNNFRSALGNIYDYLADGNNADDYDITSIPLIMQSQFKSILKTISTPYYRTIIKVDASKCIKNIGCPLLAINGTKDTQVDCEKNLQSIEKGMKGNLYTILRKDGLNHLLQHCKTGAASEYAEIEETISPEVLDDIVQWINKTLNNNTIMRQRRTKAN